MLVPLYREGGNNFNEVLTSVSIQMRLVLVKLDLV